MPRVKCKICKKTFYAKPSWRKRGWGKYCSRKCQYKAQLKGKFVVCAYCGERVYRSLAELYRESKTGVHFCNLSCHCSWKNKQRKSKKRFKLLKNLWGSWCSSSTRTCGVLSTDANSVDPPFFFLKFLKPKKKKVNLLFLKRPSKKILYNLYWKKNYTQNGIAKIFNVTHTSVKRWFNYYKIKVKSRTLSCGHNSNTLKNLKLGCTDEAIRKSAEARRIYSKEKLIEKIKDFVQKEGRIPTKNEFINNPFCPDYVTYRHYFGTWNNAIKAAGYTPNEQWFTSGDLFAKDGHKCNSISEIIIDDWFFGNHIPHIREYLYPEGRYRCDFMVGNTFIEFFGLVNASIVNPNYVETIKRKKEICKKSNIVLIELYEKDLYKLDQSLGVKIGLKT